MKESFSVENPERRKDEEEIETVDFGRRDFLKKVGAVGAVSLAAATLGRPFIENEGRKLHGETIDRESLERELIDLREKLRQERGVEIDFSPTFPLEREDGLQGEPVEFLVEKRDICEAFLQAFSLYPKFFHAETGLSVIRVVNNLKVQEEVAENIKEQDIAGLASRDDGVMQVEYAESDPHLPDNDMWAADKLEKIFPGSPEEKQERVQSIFHHELAHFVEGDDSIDEEQYSRATRGFWYDEQPLENYLSTLYTGEQSFLLKRKVITEEQMSLLQKNYAGFARPYGKGNFREDRATIAEALTVRGGSLSEMQERARTDEVLRKKIAFMKNFYFKKSRGLMGDTYWGLMEQPDVSEEMIANHLTDRAGILNSMSDKAFMLYMKDKMEENISDDELLEWKKTIREEIGKSDTL